ncbi:MAG: PAS domain S-box protein, partial [Cyanobacteria bacterium]|nr:PAS domain S-box protein [Cyanobacteriota bacterium]
MDMNSLNSSLVITASKQASGQGNNLKSTPLEDILKVILEKGCRAIHWDYGEIWLPDEHKAVLRCSDTWYIDTTLKENISEFHSQSLGWTFGLGEGLPGRIWHTQKAEWIESLAAVDVACYQRIDLAKAAGLNAILGVPLTINDTVAAVLVFYNRAETPENPSLLEMMASLTQLGFLIQHQVSEAALREREQRFRVLVENIHDYGIYLLSAGGFIQSWNPGAEKIKGYQESEILGQHFSCFFTPAEQQAGVPAQILETAANSGRYEGEGTRVRKNGGEFYAHVVVTALRDESNNVLGFTKITKDITQEQQAVANLKNREAMYSSLFEQSNDGIIIHDMEGNIFEINKRIVQILGHPFQDVLKNKILDLYPPEELGIYHQAISTIKDQGSVQFETLFKGMDKTLIPVEVSASLMTVDHHIFVQSIIRDITDRKQNEALLYQQLGKETLLSTISTKIHQSLDLRAILETATLEIRDFLNTDRVLVYRFSPDWSGSVIIESVAKDWISILDRPIKDPCFEADHAKIFATGKVSVIEDIYNVDFKPCYIEFLEQLQVKAYLLVPIISQDGLWGLLVAQHCQAARSWQKVEVEVLQQISNQVAIAIHQAELYSQAQAELKTRKAVEKELRAGENSLRTLYEITSLPDLTFEQRLEKLLRFGRHQFGLEIGRLSQIEGDKYTVMAAQISDDITTQGAILSLSQQYCQAVLDVGKTLCITQASCQGNWRGHSAYQAFRIEAYLGTPVIVNDKIYGTLCFMSHTPHQQAFQSVDREFLKLMAQWIGVSLERQQAAQALEAARDHALAGTKTKGEFLATMSHEIRTPMNAIIGMTGLLLDTALDERQQDFAETIRSSGEALLAIINDILDFSKIESGNLELEQSDFSLRTCIEESLDLVAAQANRKKLELAYQVFPKTPSVIRGDGKCPRVYPGLIARIVVDGTSAS